ncbi:MAG TPA: MATE family efflux transporter [Actinomycetota bacterium]|nr:MATE family efflux transporter [Actinomycetota bacterium]
MTAEAATPPRWARPGRHPDDRTILTLAVPALGALAADPLYSLVDTILVGHLGSRPLGALAVGTAAFTVSFWVFSFLAFGVTPKVAMLLAAGDRDGAGVVGVQALLLALTMGAAVSVAGVLFAGPVVRGLGAGPEIAGLAEDYLRIRVLASVPVLLVTVGHGWLRGAQDTKTPMLIVTAGAVANAVLDYFFIYPLGWGVAGAAWATVVGQTGAAIAFVIVLRRRMRPPTWRWHGPSLRALLRVGAALVVRTGMLLGALTIATSAAARMGVVPLASWQIAMQVFSLLAFTADSVAIAAQALVGNRLGAGRPAEAAAVARRLIAWGIGLGVVLLLVLVPLARPLASAFTDDAAVVDAAARLLLWIGLLQPVSAYAFTLDGILMGASDMRYLAGAMAVCSAFFVPLALVSVAADWGTGGLASGLAVWLVLRSLLTGWRFGSGRWRAAISDPVST